MNHLVPDFEMDDDYSIPSSSGLTRPRKSPMAEEEIMELLWQDGQVVMQSQNQRSFRRSHVGDGVGPPEHTAAAKEIRTEEESATQLFIQEDEMASWLHYPIDDSFYADLIYPAPTAPVAPIPDDVRVSTPPAAVAAATPRPPIPPPARRPEVESPARTQNFLHFSRPKKGRSRTEAGPSICNKAARDSTVVDSSETPAPGSTVSHAAAQVSGGNAWYGAAASGAAAVAVASSAAGEETGLASSPGCSGASVSLSAEPVHKPVLAAVTEDRKRKGIEADDVECQSEDVEFDFPDAKKQARGSTSTKRSRAAEVHNLSERRRRDRINEKMKALQELIPRCNKSDKASMLDEAIEYLKSLQLQVQMMSMGCTMVPMMYPGVQQYMPPMGMGMGMGMGMEMGMNHPMMPFPSVLPGSALPTAAANARLGPTFPMPAFHMPQPVPLPDPSRIQATSQSDLMLNSMGTQNPNLPRMPSFADPYQQYRGLHHMQLPLPQNQAMMQPSPSKPNGSREVETHQNLQSG
ncbi:hypothetical protein RHMOL_Rhmol01G0345100 [Rhododendron molle]|uniref:Uncharacterized protein n=3 Tax=Rhododendron molle TaxID=49168 RepID=A0ACC0QAE0_RHOML|nr:hypothetical protein RHMOL_Rhmol01G0345100 [Rhododendron molle]KAI8574318.1 hypothetical protein RHMOL_Rhmol01G0345100 [Rhododendron molle]KAI8574319.1 hypothetical protein RHMOL_Rhmol01G0345100 [Rhododendron molle]